MQITLETEYAMRIVDYLARAGRLAGAMEISEEAVVPLRFAKNILQKLAQRGIVRSYKGVHGGYELGRRPGDISLYDVLEATSGSLALNRCLLKEYECKCIPDKQCPYYKIFQQLSNELESRMREIRFDSLIYEWETGQSWKKSTCF